MRRLASSITLLFFVSITWSQPSEVLKHQRTTSNDSIKTKRFIRSSIVPATFLGLGIALNHSDVEQDFQTAVRNQVGHDFRTYADDYLQIVPIPMIYIADFAGFETTNHWFDYTKYMLFSNLLSYTITHGLKAVTNKARPAPTGKLESFPSGHTSLAFTNAAVLRKEFKYTHPVFSYSGYLVAATTGALRIINNKHWLSDVLAGAGIAMLSTEIIYFIKPFEDYNPVLKSNNLVLLPAANHNYYGIYFSFQW